jgi:UPF0716 family protein affecting phage T7 exclusion
MTTFALLLGFILLAAIGAMAIFSAGLRMAAQVVPEGETARLPAREIIAGALFLSASLVQITIAVVLNAR